MIYVKLFGVGCVKYRKLKVMVSEAVEVLGTDVVIKEYVDLDSFFAHDIKEVPALVINDKVIEHSQLLTIEECVNLFKQTKNMNESNGDRNIVNSPIL
jgi:hypothetical protein